MTKTSLSQTYKISLYPTLMFHFSDEAVNILANKINNTIYEYVSLAKWGSDKNLFLASLLSKFGIKNHLDISSSLYERNIAPVRCFGISCDQEGIADASIKMIEIINHFAAQKYILATLSPLELVISNNRFYVISYLAIKQEKFLLVESTHKNYLI